MNPYRVLGVSPSDDLNKIKRRYRELAIRYHPDNGLTGNEEVFKQISIAFNEISSGKAVAIKNGVVGKWHHKSLFKVVRR